MALTERLGYKSVNELYRTLDNNEIMEWMAYDMVCDPEIRPRLEGELKREFAEVCTAEQSADAIRQLLLGMGT